jgi:DNA-binding IclR family transcriptional regulator
MASMSTEIAVLRALLQLSRRATPATFSELLARVGPDADASELQRALGSLARSQLVTRSGESARLSLAGLAVAVAASAQARRAKTVARPARTLARRASVVSITRATRMKRHHAA